MVNWKSLIFCGDNRLRKLERTRENAELSISAMFDDFRIWTEKMAWLETEYKNLIKRDYEIMVDVVK